MVDLPLLNPCCPSLNVPNLSRYAVSLFIITRSNTLDICEDIVIGRQILGSDLSPLLNIAVTRPNFRLSGTVPSLNDLVQRSLSGPASTLEHFWRRIIDTPSGPSDAEDEVSWIDFVISSFDISISSMPETPCIEKISIILLLLHAVLLYTDVKCSISLAALSFGASISILYNGFESIERF